MGIRETLNENRSVAVGAAIGATLLAVLWIVFYSMNVMNHSDPPPARPATAREN